MTAEVENKLQGEDAEGRQGKRYTIGGKSNRQKRLHREHEKEKQTSESVQWKQYLPTQLNSGRRGKMRLSRYQEFLVRISIGMPLALPPPTGNGRRRKSWGEKFISDRA